MPPPPPPMLPGHANPHVNCPLCEASRVETMQPAEFGALRFSTAAPIWLKEHQQEISPRTYQDYIFYLQSLTSFFGELPLREIHIGHVKQYQEWRQQPYLDKNGRLRSAGASAINHEVNALGQILDRAGLWKAIAGNPHSGVGSFYKRLRVPKSRVGCALTAEEEERLFYVASASKRWEVAYLAELLSANTGAGPGEIRHLRIRDIELGRKAPDGSPQPMMTVFEGIKNEYRERSISLNKTAAEALQKLLRRYHRLLKQQKVEPDANHYLLPKRARVGRNQVDFYEPQTAWFNAWNSIRQRAGLPHVRPYDMRHHLITKMLENPDISEQVVQEIAGHVSKKMKDRYSHVRDARKRAAVTAAETKAPPEETQLSLSFDPPSAGPGREKVIAFPRPKTGTEK